MKTKEHDSMMAYLTRPGKILANNINSKKISHTERQRLAKGTKSDTTPTSKNGRMLEYINDINIIYGDKKATNAEKDAAANRQTLREATPDQLAKLQKRLDNARAFVTPPKDTMSYQDEYKMLYGKEPKKVAKKIPVIPPKPDMVNGHSDWNPDDWMHSIDPAWWLPDEPDKSSGILEQDLANEYWQEQFQNYQNNGGQLNYQQFMQLQMNNKISKEINKRVKDKQKTEGLAAILGVPGNKI